MCKYGSIFTIFRRWEICSSKCWSYDYQPLGGAQGQATDIKIAAERIIKLKEKLNRILSNNTHQPIEKIYEDTERDNFLNAKEAKEYGLIDDIIKKNEF